MEYGADIDPVELVDPERYARAGYPHEVWTRLRAEAPVARFAPTGYLPFWAITKHADIVKISAQPLRFSSAQGITLARARRAADAAAGDDRPARSAEARPGAPGRDGRFTPRAVRAKRPDIERIAVEILDARRPTATSGEFDFVAAHRRAVPDRGDRVEPRRAARRTGSCSTAGPTRSSARTIRSSGSPASGPVRRSCARAASCTRTSSA